MSPELQIEALQKQLTGTTGFWERRDLQGRIDGLQKQIEQAKEAEAKAKTTAQEKAEAQAKEKAAGQEQSKEPGHRMGAETEAEKTARLEAEQKAQQAEKDAAGKQEAGKATAQERQAEPEKGKDQERQADAREAEKSEAKERQASPEKGKEGTQEQATDERQGKARENDQERSQAQENAIQGNGNELAAGRDREAEKTDLGHHVLERTLGGDTSRVSDSELTAEERKAEATFQAERESVMEKQRTAEVSSHDPAERQQHQTPFADTADRNRVEAEAPAKDDNRPKTQEKAGAEQTPQEKEQPREMEPGERFKGRVVGTFEKDGKTFYDVENRKGEHVAVPKEDGRKEYKQGAEIEARKSQEGQTRTMEDRGYER